MNNLHFSTVSAINWFIWIVNEEKINMETLKLRHEY